MSVDNGKPNIFRIHADKPEGDYVSPIAIQAPDGEVHYRPDTGWPVLGLEYLSLAEDRGSSLYVSGWPELMQISIGQVEKYAARGLAVIDGARSVVRPSRPDPDTDESGSAKVADAHHIPDPGNPRGMPAPHVFSQADRITFHAYDPATKRKHDEVYDVIRNPDKYVAGDTSGTEQVTPDVYATGNTEVDWFYTLQRSTETQES